MALATTWITPEAYREYGDLLSADREDIASRPANQGTAQRRNGQIAVDQDRSSARANFASFRCAPRTEWPMPLLLLEKHPRSTQAFIPMNASRYVAVVALGGDEPDLRTLRAFVVPGSAAISYRPGVWHHPMIALDQVTDFACLVWEDGTPEDATEHTLTRPISLERPVAGPTKKDGT
jgi:ureidoglycolate lyase